MKQALQKTVPNQEKDSIATVLSSKLDDCKIVISALSDEQFTLITPYNTNPDKMHSSVGQHMRHVIEFIQTLIDSFGPGHVDYDVRQRNKQIEENRTVATSVVQGLQEKLDKLTTNDFEIPMTMTEAVHVTEEFLPQKSSFGRELLFAIAHTEHHFALIGAKCDQMGVALPDNFGKAISTLRYELGLTQ
ncbi:MAG: DinB family protein [Pseudomonadota bacterium]